jgi:hypothetical protein
MACQLWCRFFLYASLILSGLKILSVYMSGSKNMSYDSASLTTPDIKWLGVRPSDLNKYNVRAPPPLRPVSVQCSRRRCTSHVCVNEFCPHPATVLTWLELYRSRCLGVQPCCATVDCGHSFPTCHPDRAFADP